MSDPIAFDRAGIRSIKDEILAENEWTQIRVERGRLIVRAPQGKLTEKQRELVMAHKEELIAYLTTPPATGECIGGHASEWILTKYGDWVCSCYRAAELASALATNVAKKTNDRNCI
jgi:hypothetical protein